MSKKHSEARINDSDNIDKKIIALRKEVGTFIKYVRNFKKRVDNLRQKNEF